MEYNHYQLPTAFVDLQHFSSNGSKKQNFPQIAFCWHKIQHIQSQKNNVVYTSAK